MFARPRIPLALLLVLAVEFVSAPGRAQSPADVAAARDLFREGAKFAQEQQWAEARDRYERSLALKRAPLTLYSLGVADQNLGRVVEALESFRAFLAEMDAKNEANKPYEQPARDAIALLEPRVGKIDVHVDPPNAEGLHVLIDGIEIPKAALGVPRIVDPGEHTIVVRADGYVDLETKKEAHEGELLRVDVKLAPKGGTVLIKPPPIVPVPKPTPIVPYALVAGGGAMFLTGAIVGLVGVQKASDAPNADGPEAKKARTFGIVGDVVGGIGLVTAGAGVAFLLLSKPETKAEGAPSVSVRPVLSPGFVGVVGRF